MSKKYPVVELFGPTIQGEGIMSGTLTHFLRLGGCSLRCSWCDSMKAVDPQMIASNSTRMTEGDIVNKIVEMPFVPYVTLTGGDPCMYPDLSDLITMLNRQNYRVAVETQGMHFPKWLCLADVITFSPKGPSSGNVVDPTALYEWLYMNTGEGARRNRICIKIVIADEADMSYALGLYQHISPILYDAFYFTVLTPPFDPASFEADPKGDGRTLSVIYSMRNMVSALLEQVHCGNTFNPKVHVGCQQHVLLWPTEEDGV